MHCIAAANIAATAWRNGGGRTRELLAWPLAGPWSLRISLADIDSDGPFSPFPDVERWFAVVEGAGVTLAFDAAEERVRLGDPPLRFDGGHAPSCRLLDGPTTDLNLMVRGGQGVMRRVQSGSAWREEFAVRALFANAAGLWSWGSRSIRIAPRTLLWDDAGRDSASAWRFVADPAGPAIAGWWLGGLPKGSSR